jgi:hypothetical protein
MSVRGMGKRLGAYLFRDNEVQFGRISVSGRG